MAPPYRPTTSLGDHGVGCERAVPPVTTLRYAGISDRGLRRERNEDSWGSYDELGLFVVSDGIGGAPAGDVASKQVVETLPALVTEHLGSPPDLATTDASERLRAAVTELSAGLRGDSKATPRLAGMGATAVLAVVAGELALIGNLGDSRAYRWREHDLLRLTTDHTLAHALVDAGEITEDEADEHPARGLLTRYVGMEGEVLPDVQPVGLRPRDRLLLCSDGVTGMVDDGELQAILGEHDDPRRACRALVEAACEAGGSDNITAVVVAMPPRG